MASDFAGRAERADGQKAASTGIYSSAPGKKKFSRVQLLTIEGLMSGTQRAEHPDAMPANFKQAKKEATGQ